MELREQACICGPSSDFLWAESYKFYTEPQWGLCGIVHKGSSMEIPHRSIVGWAMMGPQDH